MKIINSIMKLCYLCMEKHEVTTIEVEETVRFKGREVTFKALYDYCSKTDQYLETEEMMDANRTSMLDAYRRTHEF